jgi:NTP pyrophosphatase (non-canonical NTP hydrolase)
VASKKEFETLDDYTQEELDEFIRETRVARAQKVGKAPPKERKKKETKPKTKTTEDPVKLAKLLDISVEEAKELIALKNDSSDEEDSPNGEDGSEGLAD